MLRDPRQTAAPYIEGDQQGQRPPCSNSFVQRMEGRAPALVDYSIGERERWLAYYHAKQFTWRSKLSAPTKLGALRSIHAIVNTRQSAACDCQPSNVLVVR